MTISQTFRFVYLKHHNILQIPVWKDASPTLINFAGKTVTIKPLNVSGQNSVQVRLSGSHHIRHVHSVNRQPVSSWNGVLYPIVTATVMGKVGIMATGEGVHYCGNEKPKKKIN